MATEMRGPRAAEERMIRKLDAAEQAIAAARRLVRAGHFVASRRSMDAAVRTLDGHPVAACEREGAK